MKTVDHTIPEYYSLIEGNFNPLPPRVRTCQQLSTYLLRDFLEENGFKYGTKGKSEIVDWLVSKQQSGKYTRYSAIPNISHLIVSCYRLYKDKGNTPLSNRTTKQITFMIKKDLETAVNNTDESLITSKSFDSMEG